MEKHVLISETEILQRFRNAWKEFPAGRIVKSESPDFILRTSRKHSIGIEITRIDTPASGKQFNNFGANDSSSKNPGGSGTTPFITWKFLESTVQRKEKKLWLYRKQMCDAYWLIITARSDEERQEPRLSQSTLAGQFDTGFHKVFLFLMNDEKIIEYK